MRRMREEALSRPKSQANRRIWPLFEVHAELLGGGVYVQLSDMVILSLVSYDLPMSAYRGTTQSVCPSRDWPQARSDNPKLTTESWWLYHMHASDVAQRYIAMAFYGRHSGWSRVSHRLESVMSAVQACAHIKQACAYITQGHTL